MHLFFESPAVFSINRKNCLASTPIRVHSQGNGFSHGLKIARLLSIFTPVCALVPPFRILSHPLPIIKATQSGGFYYWQRMRDSNPRKRSQSPVCYRYTNPLSHGRDLLYARNRKSQALFSIFHTFFSSALWYLSHISAGYSSAVSQGKGLPFKTCFLM